MYIYIWQADETIRQIFSASSLLAGSKFLGCVFQSEGGEAAIVGPGLADLFH